MHLVPKNPRTLKSLFKTYAVFNVTVFKENLYGRVIFDWYCIENTIVTVKAGHVRGQQSDGAGKVTGA